MAKSVNLGSVTQEQMKIINTALTYYHTKLLQSEPDAIHMLKHDKVDRLHRCLLLADLITRFEIAEHRALARQAQVIEKPAVNASNALLALSRGGRVE
jgi:hypothetical protein